MITRTLQQNAKKLFNNNNVRAYHPYIVDHFENPRNVGKFDKNEIKNNEIVSQSMTGSISCGDILRLQLKVNENGHITDARFKTFGCGSAIASSSYTTEIIKGKSVDEAASIKNTDISRHLYLPPIKLHCSMLAEDAIKEAVRNFKKNKEVYS